MTDHPGARASSPRLPAVNRTDLQPDDVSLFDDIANSRGGMPTSFRVFLNSPRAAGAISQFGKYVRWGTSLGDRMIEIACLRVAAVMNDPFMWAHHTVLARQAGLSESEIACLRDPVRSGGFDSAEMNDLVVFIDAELRYTMTDEIFAAVRDRLGPAVTLELALATAYYTMHHVLFAALRLDSPTDTRQPLEATPSV